MFHRMIQSTILRRGRHYTIVVQNTFTIERVLISICYYTSLFSKEIEITIGINGYT